MDTQTPETDDILDPPVPPGIVDPGTPNGQAVMGIDQLLFILSEHAATTIGKIDKEASEQFAAMRAFLKTVDQSWDTVVQSIIGKDRETLNALATAIAQYHPMIPYQATVHARSPQGFLVGIAVQKKEASDLMGGLERLLAYLEQQGYVA